MVYLLLSHLATLNDHRLCRHTGACSTFSTCQHITKTDSTAPSTRPTGTSKYAISKNSASSTNMTPDKPSHHSQYDTSSHPGTASNPLNPEASSQPGMTTPHHWSLSPALLSHQQIPWHPAPQALPTWVPAPQAQTHQQPVQQSPTSVLTWHVPPGSCAQGCLLLTTKEPYWSSMAGHRFRPLKMSHCSYLLTTPTVTKKSHQCPINPAVQWRNHKQLTTLTILKQSHQQMKTQTVQTKSH